MATLVLEDLPRDCLYRLASGCPIPLAEPLELPIPDLPLTAETAVLSQPEADPLRTTGYQERKRPA